LAERTQSFGIHQANALLCQAIFLIQLNPGVTDFLDLVFQHISSVAGGLFNSLQFVQLFSQNRPFLELNLIIAKIFLVMRKSVKQIAVIPYFQQREVIGLPMHVHQGFTNLGLNTQADRPSVHAGNRSPFRPDLAPQPKAIRLFQQPFTLQQSGYRLTFRSIQAEKTFHDRPVSTFAHAGRVHPRAKDRSQRVQDDGLARACLTGEDHQSGGELECQIIDNGKITNAQFFQHKTSKTHSFGLSISRGRYQSGVNNPPNQRHEIATPGQQRS